MNLYEINPYIRRATHSVIPHPYVLNTRTIFDYELIYMQSGSSVLKHGGKDYVNGKGDIILLHPGVPHSVTSIDEDISQPHIHFDLQYDEYSNRIYVSFKDIDKFSSEELGWVRRDMLKGCGPLLHISAKSDFLDCFFEVIDLHQAGNHILEAKRGMIRLIDMILRDNFSQISVSSQEKNGLVWDIKEYIDSNHNRPLSLSMLESQFHYSRFYIDKEFKKTFGVPVIKYYSTKRLESCKRMLARHKVSRVAEAYGFSSIYVFSRAFKAEYGVSPSEYKKTEE